MRFTPSLKSINNDLSAIIAIAKDQSGEHDVWIKKENTINLTRQT